MESMLHLFDELPEYPAFDPTIRRAPRRESKLTEADKQLAIKNALRYIPPLHHAQMAKEFAQELEERGLRQASGCSAVAVLGLIAVGSPVSAHSLEHRLLKVKSESEVAQSCLT